MSKRTASKAATPLTKSSKLASSILTATGLVCLRTSTLPGHQHHSRVTVAGIADRDSTGHRIWFLRLRDAERVLQAVLGRCLVSRKTKAGLTVKLPPDHVVDLVHAIAFSLGITPIHDADVATTLTSISARAQTAIKAMGREGTLKRLQGAAELDPAGLLARLRG